MTVQALASGFPKAVGTQVVLYQWNALANGDTGTPVEIVDLPDKTIQFSGTFGAGGTALCEGSMDGVSYFTLKDPASAVISKTAAGLSVVLEHPRYIRPRISAGDGTTSIVASLMARRGAR